MTCTEGADMVPEEVRVILRALGDDWQCMNIDGYLDLDSMCMRLGVVCSSC